jgi:hypothetical protein
MRTTARCTTLVLLLALSALGARADDPGNPKRLGEFLGLVLMCECLPYESRQQQVAFYAMMSEAYGQSYADTASGYMRATMDGFYRNTGTVCAGYVCSNDFTLYLDEVMVMTAMEDDDYLAEYGAAYGNKEDEEPAAVPDPSWCAFKPFNPQCSGDP